MKKGEYNPPHDHSDYLSFVIFLKVPDEIIKEQDDFVGNSAGPGSLSFLYGEGNRQSITYQSVKPKERDIFIFPAWIKHYVAPFYSDVTRISVSGNITNSIDLNQFNKNKNEKILNFNDNSQRLFSIVKNYKLKDYFLSNLKKNKFINFINRLNICFSK